VRYVLGEEGYSSASEVNNEFPILMPFQLPHIIYP